MPSKQRAGHTTLTSEFARRAIVPADVPLAHYVHYVREAKRVWGKALPNLRPRGGLKGE